MLRDLFIPSSQMHVMTAPKRSDTCFPNFGPDLLFTPETMYQPLNQPDLCQGTPSRTGNEVGDLQKDSSDQQQQQMGIAIIPKFSAAILLVGARACALRGRRCGLQPSGQRCRRIVRLRLGETFGDRRWATNVSLSAAVQHSALSTARARE
ncbi:hypothetical protein CCHR01_06785 [Colletotrichum chrysophilum]|uniref:Uncharacterized protein n=1 Tax=Colletotrichum chrysophilum TaxID=1836956 RepID=A0AAD9ALY3_9PEZI|nr:hypothetical protein CCHR01_06785 [Colletotrichum chrysophilum]